MTNEELFDAYRQVVSQRDLLAAAGDRLWAELVRMPGTHGVGSVGQQHTRHWQELRGIGNEPPLEDWAEC